MANLYNIYCDESRHLENDGEPIMLLGALMCPVSAVQGTAARIRQIKQAHGLPDYFELKWSKVSPAKVQFYLDVVDYFFDAADLGFRTLVVPNKDNLDHDRFDQTHDDFYYKMYFQLLKVMLDPGSRYRIYLDMKDTHGGRKVEKLHEVISNSLYDFSRKIVEWIQIVRSEEVLHVQLADLLLGAIGYARLGLDTSPAKLALVQRIRDRSGYSLTRSTLLRETKLNLFYWIPREERG